MASFTSDADWGADVEVNNKYAGDGSDFCGDDVDDIYRVANKFDITSLPTADTVSQVDASIYVSATSSVSSSTWILGAYNGNGQANPQSDSAANMYSRCDVSSDNYLSGLTTYRTTGLKTHTDLGSTANADVEAARDAGTIFSLAWRMTSEGTGNNRTEFREYTHGSTPPSLTITHAAGGGTGIIIFRRRIEGY